MEHNPENYRKQILRTKLSTRRGVNSFVSTHKQSQMISTLACVSCYTITSCLSSLVPRFSPSPCWCEAWFIKLDRFPCLLEVEAKEVKQVKLGFPYAPLKWSVSVSQVLVSADENAGCYCNLPKVSW